jgi:fibronectin-binding autotransporter adhesin
MSMRIRVLMHAVVLSALAAVSTAAFCANVTWDRGGSTDLWSNPANWSPDGVPGNSDIAFISNAGDSVLIDVNATVNSIRVENGATVTIQSGNTVTQAVDSVVGIGSTLVIDDGTFAGAGTLHLSGTVDIEGGTLDGTGPLVIHPGGLLQLSGSTSNSRLLRVTFNNSGTINFRNTILPGLHFRVGANIDNNGGVVDIQTDHDIELDSGTPILTNNSGGVIKKSAGSGSAAINFTVNNAGGATIEAQFGTLALSNGGAVSGACLISSGATLDLSGGTFTTSGSPTLTGPGTFSIDSGAALALNAGTFTMSGSPTVNGSVSIGGGTLSADAGVDVTWTNLTLASGTITGPGAVRVSGNFSWSGGTIAGSGSRLLNSGSVPTISCSAACALDGAALQFQASATFSASTNALVLSNGASLTIDAGTTLSITNGGDFTSGAGGGSISNNGTIWKRTTAGLSTISVPVTLSGTSTVDIDVGTLQFAGGAIVAANATLDVDASRTLEVTGGEFLFNSGPVMVPLGPLGGTFKVSSGTLRIPTGITIDLPNVMLQGSGFIDGGGTLILSGTSTWLGGTMGSAAAPGGITRIDSGSTLNVNAAGTSTLAQNRILLNDGTLNLANSVINLNGSATIENNGTIAKTGGAGVATIHPRVENNNGGTVSVSSGGGLTLNGGGTAGGAYSISTGSLSLGSGTFTMSATATVTGGGTLIVTGATLDADAGVDITCPNLWLSSGTITGAGAVRVASDFDWNGGTIAGSGTRELKSTSFPTISCSSGHCNLDTATLQLNGSTTFNATSNSLVFANSATLVIAAGRTLNITTDGTIVGLGTITNNGTITKSGGSGIRSIGTFLDNSGSVTVTSGGLSFLDNGTHSGSFTTTAPGSILFDGGTHTIAGGISGTGIMTIGGATVTLDSTGNVGGFTMSGGTLGGSGTLTLTNGGTWSGGTMSGSGTTAVAAGKTLAVSGFPTLSGRALDLGAGALLNLTGQTLEVASAANVTGGGTTNVNGGTLRVLSGVTQTIPSLTLTAGVIDGDGTLVLSGTSTWAGGTMGSATAPGGITRINSGHVLNVTAAGTLTLTQSRIVRNDGTINLPASGAINLSGSATIENNGTIAKNASPGTITIYPRVENNNGATVSCAAGTIVLAGGGTVSGAYSITSLGNFIRLGSGTFAMSGNPTVTGAGALVIDGATLDAGPGVDVTLNDVGLFSGTITGAGTVRVSGNFLWSGGTIAGSGPRVLNSTTTFGCTLGNCLLDGAALQIQTDATYSTSSNAFVLSNGASLTIDPGKSISITNGGDFIDGGGAASFIINNGVIWQASNVSSTIGVAVTLSETSTVIISDGTLQFGGGASVAAGATFNINANKTLEVTGGVFLFNSGTVSMPGSGIFNVSSGTLRVPSSVTATIANLTLQGSGVIDGSGTLILSGTSTWAGGTMGSATAPGGITQIDSGSALNITNAGSQSLTQGRELRNAGTVNYSGASTLTMSGAGKITNDAAFHLTADGDINVSGSATIDNNGTLDKNGGSGTSTLFPAVNSAGTVSATTGTLALAGGGTPYTNVVPTSPATIAFPSGTHSILGTITGSGTIAISGATVAVSNPFTIGTLSVTGGSATLDANGSVDAFTLTGGTLGGSGALTLNNGGTWSGGTMSGSGTTVNPAAKTLSVSTPVTLDRTLQNDGTLDVSGNITGSGSIANGGTLNAVANLTIGAVLNNSGSVVTSNVLSLAGGGTHTGSFNVTAPGNVSFSAGTHSLSGGSIGGTGTLALTGATVTVNSPFTIGALSVTAGTATLDADGSADAFTLTGGTLGGSGILTLNEGGAWSGGTMSGSGTTVNPAAKTLSVSTPVTLDRTLQNDGTLDVSGDITGSGTIDNGGTLNALADLTIGTVLNNSGQVVTSNALALAGGGTHTGSFNVTAPGNVSFSAGTHSLSGGSIGGTGTLAVTGATVTVNSPFTIGALSVSAGTATLDANGSADAFTLTGGTLSGSGTLTLNNGGTWSGGTMNGSGTSVNPAAKTLSIAAPVTLDRVLQNDGTLDVSGDITGSGSIANGGTLNAIADLTIGVVLNNSGSIVTSNTLSLAQGGTHTGSFTVTMPGTLAFSSGAHALSGGGSIGGTGMLSFSGATATVGVAINVGALNVTAGTATLDANGSADAFTMTGGTLGGNGTLTLNDGGTWSGGTMTGSGTSVNPAAKTLSVSAPVTLDRTLQNDGTLNVGGTITGSGTIDHTGTLNAVADLTIGTVLNNSGSVATSNALSLAEGGTHSGSFTVTSPGALSFTSGTHSVSGGGSIGGTGALSFSGATATVGVAVNVGALNVTAGTATLDANGSADAFTMTGGTLGGSGILTLTGGGTWSGGTMSGSGTTVNQAAMTLSIPSPVTLGRVLQNNGMLSVSGNVLGSGTIDNQGTLDAVGNSAINAALNNNGQVATSELLSLGGNGIHNGTFTATAPGAIDFSGGTQTISGTVTGTGTLRFSGAAATVSGTWSGMPIEVTGGSVALDTDGTIPALTLSGGTLTGDGDVTVSGPSTWSGGTIAGDGALTFDTGATVAMPGTNAVTLARALRNEGTIHYTAATNGMLIAGVEIRNDGTVDIQSTQGIAATAGTPPFVNFGTLQKSGGSGVLQFDAPISNRGLLRVESGTMEFGGTYTQTAGKTSIAAGATLETDKISLNGGSLTGNGTVAATVANRATVSPGQSPGTLTIDGDYVQSPDGALDIQLGGTAPGTQYDRLLVSGSVTLDGTLNVTTTNGFLAAPGNAFEILTFGSRPGGSTFAVTNGLTGSGATLAPAFTATGLQLLTSQIPVADVGIAVTGPSSTTAGTQVIYTVTVSNLGPYPATNIAVTATASPGLTLRGISGACTGSFPCTIAALSPGQFVTIQTAWDIASSATGSVQLTVNASAAADANPSNNTSSAITSLGACPAITIAAPREMTSGATAAASATPFSGATYHWTIVNGTIDSEDGTAGIAFTAGEAGTTTLTVSVTGNGCALSQSFDVTVTPRLECVGTAIPTAPADSTTTDAVVDFAWTAVDGASGYRLWLQQGDTPPRSLGTTLDTSRTKIILPGTYQWFVETLFDGCASHESERRTMTILPGEDCGSRGAPQLGAPANGIPATSAAVAFSWTTVDQALEYELWLAPAGGVPTLIRTTSDTAITAVVPPGRLEWYVRAIFAGCAATESAHRVFTYTPPSQCASPRPLLIAPVEKERLTSPVSFEWTSVAGATSYELYVDGVLTATTDAPRVSGIPLPRGERRWHVRAHLGEGCGALDSAESRFIVIPSPPSCSPLGAPLISAPARVSSAVTGRIQWSSVAGATAYVVEISGDPRFPRPSTSATTVTARQLPFTFTNPGSAPVARYVRVHAVDRDCVELVTGPFSPVAVLFVLPASTSSEGVALLTDPTDVPYTLEIPAELAGRSFTATPTVPWISVTPTSGIVPSGGQTLRAIARTAGLAPGTNTGRVDITTTAADVFTVPAPPLLLNLIPGVATAPKNTPPPDALIIPAVANVTNFIVRYHSDISVTNTSSQVMRYEINFVPSGPAGLSEGQKTNVSLEPSATMALNDIVATWFGGRTSTGTLEIRPLTEVDTSTSSAPVDGLANRITFASSRTFSTTAAGGTYGQYVPAVLYANFIAKGSTLSLQHVAQSDQFRTNLGLVEGSGDKVSLEVRIFDAAGTKLAAFPVHLNGGERAQLNGVLSEHGITLDDGRIEVEVTSGDGKVTAYASVVDNATNDPQLVPPVNLDHAGHGKWVVPGVADLASGSGNWQTDVRIFNAGAEPADLTLVFYSMNGGPPTTRTITLAPGEVRQLDRALSFFSITGDAGALHIASAVPAPIVTTARTYLQTDNGAYGQFIVAGTPDDAVAVGSRPLQILQMEESDRFKSNIGFAEVSGNPVTLEVTVFRPNSNDVSLLEVKLEPNQFRQLSSLPASLGLKDLYNARISVRAVGGEGRALAYGSLIDHKTGDPTYIPGQ